MAGDSMEVLGIDPEKFASYPDTPRAGQKAPARAAPAPVVKASDSMDVLGIDPAKFAAYPDTPAPPKPEYPVKPGQMSGMSANLGAGLKRGVIGALSFPIDTPVNFLAGLPQAAYHAVTDPGDKQPFQPTEFRPAQRALEWLGGSPSQVVPASQDEALANKAAEGVGAMLTGNRLMSTAKPALALEAIGGAAGGAAGELAQEAVPERWKPAAEMLGNMGASVATMGGLQTAGQLGRTIWRPIARAGIGPKQDAGGQRVTGEQLKTSVGAVREALDEPAEARLMQAGRDEATAQGIEKQLETDPNNPALQTRLNALRETREQPLPGLQRTTAQVVQSPEMTAMDKAYRAGAGTQFIERAKKQATAMNNTIQDLEPTSANPASVGQRFIAIQDAMETAGQQQIAGARDVVTGRTDALGGQGQWSEYGGRMQGDLQARLDPVHAQTRALWDAVDPDRTWRLPANTLPEQSRALLEKISPTAKTDEQEIGILNRAAALSPVVPFREISQMRVDANAAMKRLNADPGMDTNVQRLTLLKQYLDQTISDAMDGRQAAEARSVAAGRMDEAATMKARLEQWQERQRAAADEQASVGVGNNSRGSAGQEPGAQANGDAGVAGTMRSPGNGPTGNAGTQGVPRANGSAPEAVNVGPEHIEQYRAAVAATRAEKQEYAQGGVGDILRRQGDDYRVQAGNAAAKIFTRGRNEPAEVEHYIRAVGGPEAAAEVGTNVLTKELRDAHIVRPDGTIDNNRFVPWIAKRQDTINQFPGLAERFRTVSDAQMTLDQAQAAFKRQTREFEQSAAGSFIRDDPHVAVGKAFASGNSAATFRGLTDAVRGHSEAEAGLKRAVVDYITKRFSGATPAEGDRNFLKSDGFQRFISMHGDALKTLFGGQGRQNLEAVAAELRRWAEMTTALPGSDTAQKYAAMRKHGMAPHDAGHSTLSIILAEHGGEQLGHLMEAGASATAGLGAGAIGGTWLINNFKRAGIETRNDLIGEMLLNPALFRELKARVDAKGITPALATRIARTLQGTVLSNTVQDDGRRRRSQESKQ